MVICEKCLELMHKNLLEVLHEVAERQLDHAIYFSEIETIRGQKTRLEQTVEVIQKFNKKVIEAKEDDKEYIKVLLK